MLVWRTCYSALRTDWTTDEVAAMLDEFERARMLFRFQVAGKTYGFFPGMQKEGRLPKPSDRVKAAKQWQSGMVPAKELAKFLQLGVKKVEEEYRDLLASNSRPARGKVAAKSPTGIGTGDGVGDGAGTGSGNGMGFGSGIGLGAESEAASLPTARLHKHADALTIPAPINTNAQTEAKASSPPFASDTPHPLYGDCVDLDTLAGRLANDWFLLMDLNPHSDSKKTPPNALRLWSRDFRELLDSYSLDEVVNLMAMSQTPTQQEYYLRPEVLIKRSKNLIEDVNTREEDKRWGTIRYKYESKLRSLRRGAEGLELA
jgi:hypothetical protein